MGSDFSDICGIVTVLPWCLNKVGTQSQESKIMRVCFKQNKVKA